MGIIDRLVHFELTYMHGVWGVVEQYHLLVRQVPADSSNRQSSLPNGYTVSPYIAFRGADLSIDRHIKLTTINTKCVFIAVPKVCHDGMFDNKECSNHGLKAPSLMSGGHKNNKGVSFQLINNRTGTNSDLAGIFSQPIHFINAYFLLASDYYISS